MIFDIIPITQEEVAKLATIQLKLLRTAQQKKNELYHTLQKQLQETEILCFANGVNDSTLFEDLKSELTDEYEYRLDILREQLTFNMSLKEPTDPGDTGGGSESGGTGSGSGGDGTGYVVDYNLSYLERYVAVRDYYLTIENPTERLNLYAADGVALDYLGSYYNYLYNYLASLD